MAHKIKITCEGIKDSKPLGELAIIQGNLKTLTNKNAGKLWNSIQEHGFCVPIFIWVSGKKVKRYNILDGTQRVTVLREKQEEGWEIPPLPVVYINAPTRKKAKAILLKITSQYGTITREGFIEFTQDIDFSGVADVHYDSFDVDLVLNEPDETVDDDEIPDNEVNITEKGDLWELGRHRVLCGDSKEKKDFDKLMDTRKIFILITSPPYGVGLEYEKNKNIEKALNIDAIVKNIKNYIIEGGILCWNTQHNTLEKTDLTAWHHVQIEKNGFKLRDKICWAKPPAGPSASKRFGVLIQNKKVGMYFPNNRWETIGIFENGLRRRCKEQLDYSFLDKFRTDVWEIQSVSKHRNHPAAYPLKLVELLLKVYVQEKEICCDAYLGSGSTLIACEKTNRICYGIELKPHYVDVTINRYINWCEKNNVECTIKRNGKPFDKERMSNGYR